MFIISKVATAIMSPLGAALLGGLLALILGVAGRRRLAFGLGTLALVWLWCWSLPVTSYAIRGYLENQHPAVDASAMPKAGAIVVLGGGTAPLSYGASYPNLGAASDREWHGARLYHAGKAPLLILSGGHDPQFSAVSSAESMRRFISALGVPDSAMVLEERSRNTTQNADFTADILAREGIGRVLLVTSALHMPRAKALFEAQGVEVVAAATDHEVRALPGWRKWLPDTDALDGSGRAIKEIVGRLVGR
ncbi:MAG: YdcF family protein [Alteromonadaceae bacterium]|nr:YdcF family protein [Alteromonadaceae bacterium]